VGDLEQKQKVRREGDHDENDVDKSDTNRDGMDNDTNIRTNKRTDKGTRVVDTVRKRSRLNINPP